MITIYKLHSLITIYRIKIFQIRKILSQPCIFCLYDRMGEQLLPLGRISSAACFLDKVSLEHSHVHCII